MAYLAPEEEKRKRMIEAMAGSITPPKPQPTNETALVLPDLGPAPPPVPPPGSVRIGVGANGINGLDKALADLDTRRQADNQYKSDINTSDPNFTEINPPKMHKHGLGDTLKSLGRTALLTTGEYARTHPGASTAELLTAGATGGGIGAVSPQLGDAMFRKAQIGQAERDIVPQLGIEKERAQIDAMQARPGIQQSAQNERAINDALSQYNRLEDYDPEDPKDAGLRAVFEAKGLKLPAKTKYHRPVATWANGQLILTDASGTKAAELNGEPVVDVGRKPNEAGLTPSQQSTATNQAANREAANTRAANAQAGANQRSAASQTGADRRAAGRTRTGRTTAGDPNQMYQKASDMWSEAQRYREQAKGSNDYLEKQSLITRADKLEDQTRKLQRDADKLKASGAQPVTDKLDPEIAIKRATAKAKRALTAEEEAAIRAEVDRRNRAQ